MSKKNNRYCWCGSKELTTFSDDYSICSECHTLVSQTGLNSEQTQVTDDSKDFYGKDYWLLHQSQDLAFPNIYQRSRQDLPERCLYWLKTLLSYKLPPAKVLELGCAHGGSVALMQWAGFDATGLELSPWIVNFAEKTFNIQMLLGNIEQQKLDLQSFDAIILNDVLEHISEPVAIMQHCMSLLKDDGIMIIQTPNYIEGHLYTDLVDNNDMFLQQLKSLEHLYLFNKRSVEQLFNNLNCNIIQYKPALFDYDMYFIASRRSLTENHEKQISDCLAASASGRMIQALLDKDTEVEQLSAQLQVSEADRAARLKLIEQLSHQIHTLLKH